VGVAGELCVGVSVEVGVGVRVGVRVGVGVCHLFPHLVEQAHVQQHVIVAPRVYASRRTCHRGTSGGRGGIQKRQRGINFRGVPAQVDARAYLHKGAGEGRRGGGKLPGACRKRAAVR